METTIYRTGQMKVPVHLDSLLEYWDAFDSRRPEGHPSRSEVLYASPDLDGAHCWLFGGILLSSRGHEERAFFNEITVESDNVRVYCVTDYDMVGYIHENPTSEQIRHINNYWQNSMSLTEWFHKVGSDYSGRWEVLLKEEDILSSRIIPYDELMEIYEEEGMENCRILDLEECKEVLEAGMDSLVAI